MNTDNIKSLPVTDVNCEQQLIGFGEHSHPISDATYKTAKILATVALAILIGSALILTAIVLSPVIGITLSVGAIIAAATVTGVLLAGMISAVIYYKRCQNASFGISNGIINQIDLPTPLGKFEPCDAMVCDDGVESFEWKKKLITSAEHNIVLSGSYCGGESFTEALQLIQKQLEIKPELQVVLISSDTFIDSNNRELLDLLHQNFKDRFQIIETSDIYHINPGIKRTTNHTKVLSIDYGKYFILGGSGLEDKYAKIRGLETEVLKNAHQDHSLLGYFMPNGFRDQDFVFHSDKEQGIGKRVYIESLKLAMRWEALKQLKFVGSDPVTSKSSIVTALLLDESLDKVKKRQKVTTYIPDFHNSDKMCTQCETKIYCIGPEHIHNSFETAIIEIFNKAEKKIVIDHLYFHPSEKVMQALIEAANRGVKMTIITNGFIPESSPRSHGIFAARNRYNYVDLINSVKPEVRDNIEVFEFEVNKITLHKKVIVVDDYVIAGNSNLGYKSLVTMSDHEMNFVTKSQTFADRTSAVAKIDAQVGGDIKGSRNAKKIDNFRLDFKDLLIAANHKLFAPLLG